MLSIVVHAQVQDVGGIVERLLGFLETGRDFVTAEAIIQLKDLLRCYPAIAEASLSSVSNISPEVSSSALLLSCTQHLTRDQLVCLALNPPQQSIPQKSTGRQLHASCMWPKVLQGIKHCP